MVYVLTAAEKAHLTSDFHGYFTCIMEHTQSGTFCPLLSSLPTMLRVNCHRNHCCLRLCRDQYQHCPYSLCSIIVATLHGKQMPSSAWAEAPQIYANSQTVLQLTSVEINSLGPSGLLMGTLPAAWSNLTEVFAVCNATFGSPDGCCRLWASKTSSCLRAQP